MIGRHVENPAKSQWPVAGLVRDLWASGPSSLEHGASPDHAIKVVDEIIPVKAQEVESNDYEDQSCRRCSHRHRRHHHE
jgi:hypothetical protein